MRGAWPEQRQEGQYPEGKGIMSCERQSGGASGHSLSRASAPSKTATDKTPAKHWELAALVDVFQGIESSLGPRGNEKWQMVC